MNAEFEQGFGTGLRAQLARKSGVPVEPQAIEPEPAPVAVPSLEEPTIADADDIRAELERALLREQGLQEALQHHVEAHERELAAGRDLALKETEVEQQASRLAAAEAKLASRRSPPTRSGLRTSGSS
jgi:hypothetical protein